MAEEIKNENTTDTNNGGDPTQPVSPQGEKGVSTNEGAEKTLTEGKIFTQAELDEIVKQRLDRQKKGLPSKEEMEAFHKWQDSQKSAEQLSAEKISAAEARASEAEKKAAAAEAKAYAYSRGVSSEAVEDVIALALPKVGDNTTMEKAIDAVVAKYPAFCGKQEAKGITTGVPFGSGGGSQPSGVEAAFLAKNPGLKI